MVIIFFQNQEIMRNYCFLLFSLLLLAACGASEKEQNALVEKEAFDTMIALHDEVMPKMGPINKLSRQLKSVFPVVDSTNAALGERVIQAIGDLEEADDGMMAWMNMNGGKKLEKLQAEKSHEEIMQYIKEEENSITNVKGLMLSSIEQAEDLLAELLRDYPNLESLLNKKPSSK